MAKPKFKDLTDRQIRNYKTGGKSVGTWESRGKTMSSGFMTSYTELYQRYGVLMAVLNGRVMYVGSGTNANGGLDKRVRQLMRPTDTGSQHHGASKIRENAKDLDLSVIITGDDYEAIEVAKELKSALIHLYQPAWNDPTPINMQIARAKAA